MSPEIFDFPGAKQAHEKYINLNRLLSDYYDDLIEQFILVY